MFRRCRLGFVPSTLAALRQQRQQELARLPELIQANRFVKELQTSDLANMAQGKRELTSSKLWNTDAMSKPKLMNALDAAILTFFLHVESRVASLLGHGFYTIGPCGEELLSPIGLELMSTDPMALHYRHLSVVVARQLAQGASIEQMALDRARGHVVSSHDPVCAGAHCAIGGTPYDFAVTSTLASQTSPAVGRALGGMLAGKLTGVKCPFPKDFISFVSLGDGSCQNGHFLSGLNLAKYARFKKYRVPILFCITDNGLSISLKTHGYVSKKLIPTGNLASFVAKGSDMVEVWEAAHDAIQHVRKHKTPVALVLNNITRRFGHAGTDRQHAYLTNEEVKQMAETSDLLSCCAQLIQADVVSREWLTERIQSTWQICQDAFEQACIEPKLTSRKALVQRVSAPLQPLTPPYQVRTMEQKGNYGVTGSHAQVMRKHMNKIYGELLDTDPTAAYIGEDVTHGGYYMVTENLAKKHPLRVTDFPPDETSLIGTGMGYSQSGLLPIVEIPYAKYLDCGLDMFAEAALMHWLTNGKQTNGMIIRLQGFGRGVFGGNFHTHNMLHMPPGIDVVCYSNGPDYARGLRYCIQQAKKGRVIMLVDCTELLNLRQINGQSWEFSYTEPEECLDFDAVTTYSSSSAHEPSTLVVSYGGGLVSSLEVQHRLAELGYNITVVDAPLLSAVPKGLKAIIPQYKNIVFADICKEGGHPFASHMCALVNDGSLTSAQQCRVVTAQRTYNPLGTTLTFLSTEDIVEVVLKLHHTSVLNVSTADGEKIMS